MPELENQNLIAERTWEQIFEEAKVPSETNPIPSVRMDSVFGGRYIGVSLEGAKFKSSESGARVEIFSDPNTGFVCYASDNSVVFKTVVGGSDVGDVVIGNFEAGHGAKWDQSAGTFTVKGNLEVNSLDIPDKVSNDSFHVDTSGNVWWGATTIDNATAKILNTGVAMFRQVGTTVMGSTLSFQDIFGDGADGNVTISTDTVLTDDKFYNNLTINAGATLYPAGYRIFVKGTLTNNGKIARDGNNGGNGDDWQITGPAGGGYGGSGLSSGSLYGSLDGKNGGSGGWDGAGQNGYSGVDLAKCLGSNAASGGNGGMGGSGVSGGTGGEGGVKTGTIYNYPRNVVSAYMLYDVLPSGDVLKTNPSAGGGGGGGLGRYQSNGGGGGGGSGSGGGIIAIFARTLINNGVISAKGGNGGNGGKGKYAEWDNLHLMCLPGGGGGGGGGGGNGGIVILAYTSKSGTGTIDVSGGTGGTGGAGGDPLPEHGCAGGYAGSNGQNGVAGKIFEFVV